MMQPPDNIAAGRESLPNKDLPFEQLSSHHINQQYEGFT